MPAPDCIIVTGPKPGAGRTTLATHLAVALLRMGRRAGIADLDVHERGLSRWAARRRTRLGAQADLVMPASADPVRDRGATAAALEAAEHARWPSLLEALGQACEVLVIDAPDTAGLLLQDASVSAGLALTVVTDSPTDADLLFDHDAAGGEVQRPSAYGRAMWEARRRRAQRGLDAFDWVLVRNRALTNDASAADADALDADMARAGELLGARPGPRLTERFAWRTPLTNGLTLFDAPYADDPSLEPARQELRDLVIVMKIACLEGAALDF